MWQTQVHTGGPPYKALNRVFLSSSQNIENLNADQSPQHFEN